MKRRQFIKKAGAAGAGIIAIPHLVPMFNRSGANDQVVIAIAGIHSRGAQLADEFASIPGCEIRALVDVDNRYFDAVSEKVTQLQGSKPLHLTDYRKALDDKDIDAIVIATPDHWHAPMAIEAVKAGKHVYVEKPCSHNPYEGELLVEAFRKYRKLIQMGNQRRSMKVCQQMVQEIGEGVIGNVYLARTWYTNNRMPIGFGKVVPVPEYLDYELWQGPAPRMPYRDNIHPYNWHWFWHWGTGEALNNGTHEIDVARWALGVTYPLMVTSLGGRFHYVGEDDWECPDTQMITYEFQNKKMITWEGRSCNSYDLSGEGRGVILHGTKGSIVFLSDKYKVYDAENKLIRDVKAETQPGTDPTNTRDPGLGAAHTLNFIEAVRGREQLNSPVDEGQKSILLCQLGNISLRTGSTLYINQDTGYVMENAEAERLWRRDYEPGWKPKV